MSAIDINNSFFYMYNRKDKKQETKLRLQQLVDLGCTELGVASFGIDGVFSGLYIERVWNLSEKDWNDYLNWIIELKNK